MLTRTALLAALLLVIAGPAFAQDAGEDNSYASAYATMQEHQSANANEFGNMLEGNATYVNPETGDTPVLSYMPSAEPTTDPSSGWSYAPDPNSSASGYIGTSPSGDTSVEVEQQPSSDE